MEDVAKATDLTLEIGSMIVGDVRYSGKPWQSITVIVTLDGPMKTKSGFYWDESGEAYPDFPDNPRFLKAFKELQAATRSPDGRDWKAALVQLKRDTMKMSIDYEYDDINRWNVTPQNIDRMREELRPR